MPATVYPAPRRRSLDVFRGMTVLGMVVVNAADLGGQAHPWLRHSPWDGCTPADLVFPAFLFIMGTALGLALHAYAEHDWTARQIYTRVLRRGLILFALGMLLNLASSADLENLRIMGVLQRIALCYVVAAVLLLQLPARAQYVLSAVILLAYWAALRLIPVPDEAGSHGHLPGYLDRMLLGRSHLLQGSPYEMDPEGVLTTLPATVNVLLGAFAGRFLTRAPLTSRTSARLFAAGVVSLGLGLLHSLVLPLNKALWTSSYVLVTSGAALCALAALHELVDVRHRHVLLRPFEVIGMNAMLAYLVSTILNVLALRAMHSSLYPRYLGGLLEGTDGANVGGWVVVTQVLLIWALMEFLHRRGWYLRI